MANRPALAALSLFISQPTSLNSSCHVNIPCIYEVLQYHEFRQEIYPVNLLGVCNWVLDRGSGALVGLITYPAPTIDVSANQDNVGWQAVSIAVNHCLHI
jgi:hypothetical protein